MTEQTPSAEALRLANCWVQPYLPTKTSDANAYSCAQAIDALCEQRVSAERERCARRSAIMRLKTLGMRPLPSAPASTGEQPAPPAAVVDYTERAREEAWFAFLVRMYVQRADARQQSMSLQYTEAETHDLAKECARYEAAVASERDAAAIRAFGKRVWSDTEEVAYQAGVSDMRARLREPDEALVKAVAVAICEAWFYCAIDKPDGLAQWRKTESENMKKARAALTKVAEMLK